MLAVVVDLGWPWWVTTMIALAVATAAGAAFFVTRRPPARGVLATLAVQGVVLAAVAPLVMDTAGNTATVMGESSSEAKTLVLDVQPEASKFNFTDSQGNKKVDFGDHFLFQGPVFKEGTTENVGTWFCAGVKFATLNVTALDKPLTLTGAIESNMAIVYVVYLLKGRGTITVTGLEPGYDGSGANVQVVTGGTGEFAGARGTATNVFPLGVKLSPPFAAPANRNEPRITFNSRRVTFDYVTGA